MAWLSPTNLGAATSTIPAHNTITLPTFTNPVVLGHTIFVCISDAYGASVGSISDNASPPNTYTVKASFTSVHSGSSTSLMTFFTALCRSVPTQLTYTASGVGSSSIISLISFTTNAGAGNVDSSSIAGTAPSTGGIANINFVPRINEEFGVSMGLSASALSAPTDNMSVWTPIG